MSRTDKDMAYELRLEDELAARTSGRQSSNVELYRARAWIKTYEDVNDWPGATIAHIFSDGRVMAFIYTTYMFDRHRSYGSCNVRDSKIMARRIERRTQKNWLTKHYSSIDYEVEISPEYEVGTKARGLAYYWW